jgi:polar amino acid transport system substrate-binding protein
MLSMLNSGKRTFLFHCALAAGQLLCPLPARGARQTVTLIVAEALDERGKMKAPNPRLQKLLSYLELELGLAFDVRMYPWPRAERYAEQGLGLIFGLSKTPDRLSEFHFSEVAESNKLWLVTRSDATFPFRGVEDLRGKTVGAVRGYHYGDAFQRAKGKLFQVDEGVGSRAIRLRRLMLKRVDVALLFQPQTQSAAEAEANINAFMALQGPDPARPPQLRYSVLPTPLETEHELRFAIVRDKDDGIIERIDAALAQRQKAAAPVAGAGAGAAR